MIYTRLTLDRTRVRADNDTVSVLSRHHGRACGHPAEVLPAPGSKGIVVNEAEAGAHRGEILLPGKGDGHSHGGEEKEEEVEEGGETHAWSSWAGHHAACVGCGKRAAFA